MTNNVKDRQVQETQGKINRECSHIFNKGWQTLNSSTLCPTSMSYSFIEIMSWLSESNTVTRYCNGIIWMITLCEIIQQSKNYQETRLEFSTATPH